MCIVLNIASTSAARNYYNKTLISVELASHRSETKNHSQIQGNILVQRTALMISKGWTCHRGEKKNTLGYPLEDLAQEIRAYDQLVMRRETRQSEEPLTDQWQNHGQKIRRAYDQQGLGWLAKRNEELMTNTLEDADYRKERKRERETLLKTDNRGRNWVRQRREMSVSQDTGYSVDDLRRALEILREERHK